METTTRVSILIIALYSIRYPLRISLQEQGYMVVEADTQNEGLAKLSRQPIDVTIYAMPNDIKFIKQLRRVTQTPILIISHQMDETLIAEALDAGADDYIVLPYIVVELLARVRVALRHRQLIATNKILKVGELVINLFNQRVNIGDEELYLTFIEYKILLALSLNVRKLLTYEQLSRHVWGETSEKNTLTLRTTVHTLRKKLEEKGLQPYTILTKYKMGYALGSSEHDLS